ncbi:class I SAM-dependent methyltransferase [Polaribacter sp.]|uniref:class I SAM-dependent methyltransferase n=1 Tax=Polaribacter sp. TaxID=1920175 RepID=UPI003EF1FA64
MFHEEHDHKQIKILGETQKIYENLIPFLDCIDYTVSKEKYEVKKNAIYDMLVTVPVPENLEDYYKSKDYISHTDSKKSLFDKVYQAVKFITLKRKLKLMNSFKTSTKNILDVGAGTGDFLKTCKENNWNVSGVEPSLDAINIAAVKGVFLKENLSEFKNEKFDVITLWHVLEHVENLKEYMATLKNLLSENGRLVIAVPNYKSYDANYYKEFWAAFDVPRHLWHFSQNSIHTLFSEVNMSVEKTIPMKFDAYYVSLLSEKYKSKKTNPFQALYRGFLSNSKAKTSKEYSSLIYVIKNS